MYIFQSSTMLLLLEKISWTQLKKIGYLIIKKVLPFISNQKPPIECQFHIKYCFKHWNKFKQLSIICFSLIDILFYIWQQIHYPISSSQELYKIGIISPILQVIKLKQKCYLPKITLVVEPRYNPGILDSKFLSLSLIQQHMFS